MKKVIFLSVMAVVLFSACQRSGQGHLTGVLDRPDGFYGDPPGMVFVPMGSFTMGPSDQDVAYAHNAFARTISIPAFYMDETEITNNQYRQFVFWVRDSIARTMLAALDPEFLIEEDQFGNLLDPPLINWRQEIRWNEPEVRETLAELYLPEQERFFRRREVDSRQLIYRYQIIDLARAARRTERETPRSELVIEHATPVYPDTLAWIHDFTYSYNEPMTQHYFWHPTFDHYPVVGVNWMQARAFNVWRTQVLNSYLAGRERPFALEFSLPSEAQWEYAARGGLELSPFPWGGPYIRNQDGCFLANFKPLRGNYVADGGYQTIIVGHYPPNDFGLYDMAGNVAEWTRNAYDESFYIFGSDMNPDFQFEARPEDPPALKRKVVRGGSWKDVGFMLQVSTRTYEYQDTAKSYIGFRSIQTFPGRDRDDRRGRISNVY
ncbi:MAG TPA: SUMF1/EgtB/PvdO family nonheme iron enzyme [Bacteroidales bacterium]|nr:SUMF1/EgtB/PvdO family nonheme iron enzyme [Bacteroidales bacterium]